MNLSIRHAFLLAALALAPGCATTPPEYRYYTLDMQPRANVTAPVRLASVRIEVNEALQQPAIMIRTSPTRVEYYALDRWASGLQEQIAEKLKIEFANPVPDAPLIQINARLMSCEQVDTPDGPQVRIKLEVQSGDAFQKIYTQTGPASAPNAAAAVEALSRATEAIATELAADLRGVVTAPDKH
jgi:uncharacterized lipoprotein YmbA